MTSDTDKRQEHRFESRFAVFIEVFSSVESQTEKSKILICQTLDVSANGMRIALDEPLVAGSIHQVCIQLNREQQRIFVSAEVKWCADSPEHQGFIIGLEIFESDNTDIQQWKEIVADFSA